MPNSTGKEVVTELEVERQGPPLPCEERVQRPKVERSWGLVGVAGNAGGCTEGSVVGRDEMNGKDRRGATGA